LTLCWRTRQPIIQTVSPARLVAQTLSAALGPRISDYVYVDFASGAGGPTPYIERILNKQLRDDGKDEVKMVLSDLKPHLSAWEPLAKKSENLSYIPQGVDAANCPAAQSLLKDVPGVNGKKVMRLFSLAFHHFDDDLAANILENTIETSDGFCIFELQSRHISSFLLVSLTWPLLMLLSPFYFYNSPAHLFFTYLVPLVPFVVVFDGYISSLRTRTPEEVQALMRSKVDAQTLSKWKFRSGESCHTWPIGFMNWIICTKED